MILKAFFNYYIFLYIYVYMNYINNILIKIIIITIILISKWMGLDLKLGVNWIDKCRANQVRIQMWVQMQVKPESKHRFRVTGRGVVGCEPTFLVVGRGDGVVRGVECWLGNVPVVAVCFSNGWKRLFEGGNDGYLLRR